MVLRSSNIFEAIALKMKYLSNRPRYMQLTIVVKVKYMHSFGISVSEWVEEAG
ncbi:MAG: hypothetical protein LBF71_05775 [Campylobacteraceae bacterium]|nr:hypothetical protein [Campylobacteraceae bacterium]